MTQAQKADNTVADEQGHPAEISRRETLKVKMDQAIAELKNEPPTNCSPATSPSRINSANPLLPARWETLHYPGRDKHGFAGPRQLRRATSIERQTKLLLSCRS
jgi:hypothetical protein